MNTVIRIMPGKKEHIVSFLRRESFGRHNLDTELVKGMKLRYMKFRKLDGYNQILPFRFLPLDQGLFCCALPTTADELLTLHDYFMIDVIINFNICPLNPKRVINIETGSGGLGFTTKFTDMNWDGLDISKLFDVYNFPTVTGNAPCPKLIRKVVELFQDLVKNGKRICFVCYDGMATNFMFAILFLHVTKMIPPKESRSLIRKYQKKEDSMFTLSQCMYLYHNPRFPFNDMFENECEGPYSPSNTFKRQLSFMGSPEMEYYMEARCHQIHDIHIMKIPLLFSRNSSVKPKAQRKVMLLLRDTKKLDPEAVNYLCKVIPIETVKRMIGNYENLYREMKSFYYLLQNETFKKDFKSYWEIVMNINYNENPDFKIKERIRKFKVQIYNQIMLEEKIERRKRELEKIRKFQLEEENKRKQLFKILEDSVNLKVGNRRKLCHGKKSASFSAKRKKNVLLKRKRAKSFCLRRRREMNKLPRL